MPSRKNDALHRRSGTYRRDRHGGGAGAASGGAPVGKAPAYFTADQRAIWQELSGGAPWLSAADRAALELAVRAVAALRSSPSPPPALLAQVGRALDRLALSPGARGENSGIRPNAPDEPGNPFGDVGEPVRGAKGRRS